MKINEENAWRLVREVAPKVEEMTQWVPQLDRLSIQVVNRSEAFDKMDLDSYQGFCLETEPKTKQGRILKRHKRLKSLLSLATYNLKKKQISLVRNNFACDTTENDLSIVLGHELVHFLQYEDNPDFKRRYLNVYLDLIGKNAFDANPRIDPNTFDVLIAMKALIEGDAKSVQESLTYRFYQDAEIKTSFFFSLLNKGLPFYLGLSKIHEPDFLHNAHQKYKLGLLNVESIHHQSRREGFNRLYDLGGKDLVDVLLAPRD